MSAIHSIQTLRLALVAGLIGAAAFSISAFAQDAPVFTDDAAAKGETPEAHKGYDIAARSDRSDAGFGDSKVDATMILRNAAGQSSERSLSFSTLEKKMRRLATSRSSFLTRRATSKARHCCRMQKSLILMISGCSCQR